jgi:hypothetical protein
MRLRPIEQMAPKIAAAVKLIDAGIGEFIPQKTVYRDFDGVYSNSAPLLIFSARPE